MDEVGIRALKQNASAVVARVAAGASLTITVRGRPVAQMAPVQNSRIETLIQGGRARPSRRRLSDLPPPAESRPGTPPLSEELEKMRQAERY
ncbi:MAG: type II toxin-antitoxin system prevent-host-death family antitoxin [Acidimicrobiia bacterium]|nr:type II toxin-antitoxin system prevent-host-death family antitoxin [bacterium]MXW69056.1 type II toxin-antitoxin system prevent-host-death family antitoxin [Acidimicrobiia bacterium]MDE0675472.1 type II toxin-antitoxin system prevent-host-death family antitoxin [bacterium]MXX00044.1 type II toxin-antitoxin system prevent-host-death family antitoxin [Acidimicrobiia bacterium]MXX44790.1 type II toxin-antitoxin system prevent-host-death family antitoxin [Acidimicrobiia bacterium]